MPDIIDLNYWFADSREPSGQWLPVGVEYCQEECTKDVLAADQAYSLVCPYIEPMDQPSIREFVCSIVTDPEDRFSGQPLLSRELMLSRDEQSATLCCRHLSGSVLRYLLPLRSLGPLDLVVLIPDIEDHASPPALENEYWRELIIRAHEFFVLGRYDDSFEMVRLFAAEKR
ncbi:hypothetical protein KQI84_05145 [bacterium]|nr:hypothetical protein [bacterium]